MSYYFESHTICRYKPFFSPYLLKCKCGVPVYAESISAYLKDQCSAVKKKCLYSEDSDSQQNDGSLGGCTRISGGEGKIFMFIRKSLRLKRKRLRNSFKIRRLGLYFSFYF